jgi:hypothetical protein
LLVPWLRNLNLGSNDDMNSDYSYSVDSENSNVFLNYPENPSKKLESTTSLLVNLIYITYKFSNDFITEIESLWTQLSEIYPTDYPNQNDEPHGIDVGRRNNIDLIIDFLIELALVSKNSQFIWRNYLHSLNY